jgi:hypothetical protein
VQLPRGPLPRVPARPRAPPVRAGARSCRSRRRRWRSIRRR